MRIAQKTVTRNYINNIHKTQRKQAESMERGTTGLKFSKLSQNVADGVKAMRTQEARIRSEANLSTVETLMLEFKSLDSNLGSIDDILKTVQEKTLKAMNDPNGEVARDVLAGEIISLRDQILQFINTKFGDKYLFNGTDNSRASFDTNVDGKLAFNGIALEDIYKDAGVFYYDDPVNGKTVVPDSGDIYMDIGLGMSVSSGEVDPRSAFNASVSGLDVLCVGPVDAEGCPSNIYDVLTDLAAAVDDESQEGMSKLYTKLVKLTDTSRMTRTEAGVRANFLERTKERLDMEIDSLGEMESNLITVDLAEEAITQKTLEYTWLATLQLGANILPSSLLDFLR